MYDKTLYVYPILLFSVSSVAMMLSNKIAVTALQLPCTLVLLQMVATLVLLIPFRSEVDVVSWTKMWKWMPIAFFFALMLLTSMMSFFYANVPTIIIFRNLASIVATVAEYHLLGEGVSLEIIVSELSILLGAVIYGRNNSSFSAIGFFWMFFNIVAQVAYGILVKHMTMNTPEFSSATKYTLSLYNNLIAMPLVFIFLLVQDDWSMGKILSVGIFDWFWIAVSCVCGFMISTSGFGLQKLVSATSFLVINNLTKFFNIIIGVFILRDPMGFVDGLGCVIALLGGVWYSVARYRFKETPQETGEKKDNTTANKTKHEFP